MSIALKKVEEKVDSEEVFDYFVGDQKSVWALEIIGKSEHVYEARIPNHEEDDDIKNGLPFALWTDDQVALNEGPLHDFLHLGLIRINFIVRLFNHRLICLDSLLNLVGQQPLRRSFTIYALDFLTLSQFELVIIVPLFLGFVVAFLAVGK